MSPRLSQDPGAQGGPRRVHNLVRAAATLVATAAVSPSLLKVSLLCCKLRDQPVPEPFTQRESCRALACMLWPLQNWPLPGTPSSGTCCLQLALMSRLVGCSDSCCSTRHQHPWQQSWPRTLQPTCALGWPVQHYQDRRRGRCCMPEHAL